MTEIEVTAIVKARNEERQIRECLESARLLAQEIIVINTSEDRTGEIAESLGAIVHDAPKSEYANSDFGKGVIDNFDTEGWRHATGKWVILLDADERVTEPFAEHVREVIAEGKYDAICYPRKNVMFGGWARHGGWFATNQLKCFRRTAWNGEWTAAQHGQPVIAGEILQFPTREDYATLHLNYDSVAQMVSRTLLHYAMDEAQTAKKAGRRPSLFRLVWRPPRIFATRYFLRGGFRDGIRGLILAGMLAMYQFLIEANLWDICREEGSHRDSK